MDRGDVIELVPHYAAMLLLVFLALGVLRTAFGDLGFWIELAIVGVVVFGYRPVVRRLGVAPRVWEDR